MKYVDEFRDSEKAGFLIREIEALVSTMTLPSDRPIYIMEVCGGHTHSIFRDGLKGMLPKEIKLIHRPGFPGFALPRGRGGGCGSLVVMPEVNFAAFGDSLWVT